MMKICSILISQKTVRNYKLKTWTSITQVDFFSTERDTTNKTFTNSRLASLEIVNEETDILYLSIYNYELNQTNRIALDTLNFVLNPSYMLDVDNNDRLVVFYKYSANTYKLKIFNSGELSEGSEIRKLLN